MDFKSLKGRLALACTLCKPVQSLADKLAQETPLTTKRATELKLRAKDLTSTFKEIKNLTLEFFQGTVHTDSQEREIFACLEEFNDMYYDIQAKAADIEHEQQKALVQTSSIPTSSTTSSLKLPKIKLPTFTGNYEDYNAFKQLFEVSIHNNKVLSDIEKFQYLTSCLSGVAYDTIKALPITEANYQVARTILEDRFQNKRRVVTSHVNRILSMEALNRVNGITLRNFISTVKENLMALVSLGYPKAEGGIFLSAILINKLDLATARKFEGSRTNKLEFPQVDELLSFLEKECLDLENTPCNTRLATSSSVVPQRGSFVAGKYYRTTLTTMESQNARTCFFCHHEHSLYTCPSFARETPVARRVFVKTSKLCFNCLGSRHSVKDCRSRVSCHECSQRHHTSLHLSDNLPTQFPEMLDEQENHSGADGAQLSLASTSTKAVSVLLGTTLVQLVSPSGASLVCRAVLDSASQTSFITREVARHLGIKVTHTGPHISGVSTTRIKPLGTTQLHVNTLEGEQVATNHPVMILDKITEPLPQVRVHVSVKNAVADLNLADPNFHHPGKVDCLLDATLFARAVSGQSVSLGEGMPVAMLTIFGAVLMGEAPMHQPCKEDQFSGLVALLAVPEHDLNCALKKFWEIEEVPHKHRPVSVDDDVETHFVNTHTRDSAGKYQVCLPVKQDHLPLGESGSQAKQRFLALERKFKALPEFAVLYKQYMQDYELAGYMTPRTEHASPTSEGGRFYIPHHGVQKDSSKIRVVFDASAKTSTGVSLNDILLPGPKLQRDITDIIMNFRRHAIVFSCDIRQMFLQVNLHPNDRPYQTIYWRASPSDALKEYELTTVTFGISCSPFLAIRTLQQLALDEGHKFPHAVKVLEEQTYVDDIVSGADSLQDALQLQQELVGLLACGGFQLRKWTSNHPTLLEQWPADHHGLPLEFDGTFPPTFKILGIQWNPSADIFSFTVSTKSHSVCTKRGVLSTVAGIYDPCGWATPVTFWAKAFIQLLWASGLTWDEQLPADLAVKWKRFLDHLPALSNVKIVRHLQVSIHARIELHGFCDASEAGYAAVVYLRSVEFDLENKISLLAAKSRVAPLKKLSLPRLELCAAYLLAKLLHYCVTLMSSHYQVTSVHAWSDSAVSLAWIQTPSYRLKTFVGNRVSQIQDWVDPSQWHHVPSAQNPADCASRGISPLSLAEHPLWWTGPRWLKNMNECPPNAPSMEHAVVSAELKEIPLQVCTATTEHGPVDLLLCKFSDFTKLQRVVAFVKRFCHNARNRDSQMMGELSVQELAQATTSICYLVQHDSFASELMNVEAGKQCSPGIQRLAPFVDGDKLLRVGGRLENSDMSYENKHPIILPKTHHVTKLLIECFHRKHLHAGPQLLQSLLMQQYWILSARSVIRSCIFSCKRCFRCKPRNSPPKMGDLPSARVIPSPVFQTAGVDYAGPFKVKIHTLRRAQVVKAYLCVFVCFSTKAVHLEVTTSLTSEAYLAALTRFISRRGTPVNLHSDCGTNFIGASRLLDKELRGFLLDDKNRKHLHNASAALGINFHFLPPAAPHQGGLWEAAVKSAKFHLVRVVGEQILTLEEFMTLTGKVEAVLNSRPMTALSADPSDMSALTPGHFLIGRPLSSPPEADIQERPLNRLTRWRMLQAMSQRFWKRWQSEYLQKLQTRGKWLVETPALHVGDLVLIHEENAPPLQWCMGRVTVTYPGADDTVRVAKVKTQTGSLTRPVHKLFPLPV